MVHWKNLQKRWSPILSYLSHFDQIFVWTWDGFSPRFPGSTSLFKTLRLQGSGPTGAPLWTFEKPRWHQNVTVTTATTTSATTSVATVNLLVNASRDVSKWEVLHDREWDPTLKKNYGEVPQNYTQSSMFYANSWKMLGFTMLPSLLGAHILQKVMVAPNLSYSHWDNPNLTISAHQLRMKSWTRLQAVVFAIFKFDPFLHLSAAWEQNHYT